MEYELVGYYGVSKFKFVVFKEFISFYDDLDYISFIRKGFDIYLSRRLFGEFEIECDKFIGCCIFRGKQKVFALRTQSSMYDCLHDIYDKYLFSGGGVK